MQAKGFFKTTFDAFTEGYIEYRRIYFGFTDTRNYREVKIQHLKMCPAVSSCIYTGYVKISSDAFYASAEDKNKVFSTSDNK